MALSAHYSRYMNHNPNLTPMVLADKDGKLTTRHVRTAPKTASKSLSVPAPSLGKPKTSKALSRFMEQEPRSFASTTHIADKEMMSDDERSKRYRYNIPFEFTASDQEIYDVLSVVEKPGTALVMMNRGVRSADEARAYLQDQGSEHLIVDRSSLVEELLSKKIKVADFMDRFETLRPSTQNSPHLADAIAFTGTTLNKNDNSRVRTAILAGVVSYDDIKYIGIPALTSHSKLYGLSQVLAKHHAGTADYSLDDIKDLVKRANAEKCNAPAFSYAVKVFDREHRAVLDKVKHLNTLANYYQHYAHSPASENYDNPVGRALYTTLLTEGLTDGYLRELEFADGFFEHDIPLEIAINVVENGGGVLQARAIHEDGIHSKLAEGWL